CQGARAVGAGLDFHGPRREGNLDILLAVAAVEPFDELVPEQVLVAELLRPENHRKVDARLAKAAIANDGCLRRHPTRDRAHDLARHLDGHALYLLEIALVPYPDIYQHRERLLGRMKVREDGRGKLRVGDDDQVVADMLDGR